MYFPSHFIFISSASKLNYFPDYLQHISLVYSPSIFPATLSTASFNPKAAFTTISFSSSPHSAMNVAVSITKPGFFLFKTPMDIAVK